jgi:hypothetical protein
MGNTCRGNDHRDIVLFQPSLLLGKVRRWLPCLAQNACCVSLRAGCCGAKPRWYCALAKPNPPPFCRDRAGMHGSGLRVGQAQSRQCLSKTLSPQRRSITASNCLGAGPTQPIEPEPSRR